MFQFRECRHLEDEVMRACPDGQRPAALAGVLRTLRRAMRVFDPNPTTSKERYASILRELAEQLRKLRRKQERSGLPEVE